MALQVALRIETAINGYVDGSALKAMADPGMPKNDCADIRPGYESPLSAASSACQIHHPMRRAQRAPAIRTMTLVIAQVA